MCRVTSAWLAKPWKNSWASWASKPPIIPDLNGTFITRPGAAGEIDHHPRQRLVERHVGVAVADQAALVADRLADRLAEGDADVLDGVVAVDVQVALGLDLEIDQAVAGDLLEHVVEEADAGGELGGAGAVEVDARPGSSFPWCRAAPWRGARRRWCGKGAFIAGWRAGRRS